VMMEGNYLINIRIWEASDLIPRGTNSYVNPYCIVSVMNRFEKTKVSKKTLSPVWDKSFTFEFSNLKKQDLESAIITVEVFDSQYLVFSESVGKYEIDLTSVYYEQYHQFYRTWFTLVDADDKKEGCMGYVMLSIDVLGPSDKPHVREKITEDSVTQTVISKKIPQIGFLVIAEIFRAEHLVSMNMMKKTNDAIVKLNYGGASVSSSIVDDNNPTWNEVLYLQAMMPNHSKNLQVELWNKNKLMQDDLVGTCLIPFNSFHCIDNLPPTWVNIYGPPLCGVGPNATEMAEHGFMRGSCYRGRVLMRVNLHLIKVKLYSTRQSKEQGYKNGLQDS
jgi:Ca2+-dependent lipid-binding protein